MLEELNRIANSLFLEWCESFDDAYLKNLYERWLERIHRALDDLET